MIKVNDLVTTTGNPGIVTVVKAETADHYATVAVRDRYGVTRWYLASEVAPAALSVPLVPVATVPARSERDAYYDLRFAYYRTMGEDYTDAAAWAAADRDARFTRWERPTPLTGF